MHPNSFGFILVVFFSTFIFELIYSHIIFEYFRLTALIKDSNSFDKLNWKRCSKNKKESVSYPRRIWNRLWKQCTKLRGNTRRTSWIVKDVHSFHSDLCESNLATLKRSYIQRFYTFLSQNLIFGGNYQKSYRKSIYRPIIG